MSGRKNSFLPSKVIAYRIFAFSLFLLGIILPLSAQFGRRIGTKEAEEDEAVNGDDVFRSHATRTSIRSGQLFMKPLLSP